MSLEFEEVYNAINLTKLKFNKTLLDIKIKDILNYKEEDLNSNIFNTNLYSNNNNNNINSKNDNLMLNKLLLKSYDNRIKEKYVSFGNNDNLSELSFTNENIENNYSPVKNINNNKTDIIEADKIYKAISNNPIDSDLKADSCDNFKRNSTVAVDNNLASKFNSFSKSLKKNINNNNNNNYINNSNKSKSQSSVISKLRSPSPSNNKNKK